MPAVAGTSTLAAGGVDVAAGGTDIGGSADQFHFFYGSFTNDFDVAVRVESLANSDVWAKAGLMARETLDATSDHVSVLASPTLSGCFLETRAIVGGTSALRGSFPVNYPEAWLRLERTGDAHGRHHLAVEHDRSADRGDPFLPLLYALNPPPLQDFGGGPQGMAG